MEQRVRQLESDVTDLKTRVAVAESNITDIKTDLASIKNNTTWLLRIVIGAIVLSLLGLLMGGGEILAKTF
ncbi:hemolysin XhlA family protein [Bacillus carboniphilus]|uniref:Hemolysin XhlA family protein n=1 Tax=Bacillus carboniphilus TaxID=86663 RepID=A0ABY9JS58_9BACI|nr:hemolysin XhlA family protein [Bacillus carboniphilus]WLR41323.1 hemolysin XhlA family protein [Bacillus carboniphilus]